MSTHNTCFYGEYRKLSLNEPCHEKTCLTPYAIIKDADQPAHPRSLIVSLLFASKIALCV